MTAALARRLGRLEAAVAAELDRRTDAALRTLGATMAPEHVALIQAWQARPEIRADFAVRPRDVLLARLLRLDPPALVRAAMLLVAWHLSEGRPLALPDYVADVYVDDPEAIPGLACAACGYCMPAQGRILADGRVEYGAAGYLGPCPVCAGNRSGRPDD